jgi:predicted amidophosphoribosyltransferase
MQQTKTIFQHITDLIYPLGVPNFEDSQGFSFTKDLKGLAVDNIWIANSLGNEIIGKTIVRIKDGGEFALVRFLAEDFVKQIIEFGMITASRKDFEDQESKAIFETFARLFDPNTKTLLTFVPPDPARLTKRGFHLPEMIAQELQKQLNLKANGKKAYVLQNLFVKAKKTKRQTGLDRQQRLVNLTGKIVLRSIEHGETGSPLQERKTQWNDNFQSYKSIFIIDDVCTTGATINECAIQIKAQFPNIKVYGLAVASNL